MSNGKNKSQLCFSIKLKSALNADLQSIVLCMKSSLEILYTLAQRCLRELVTCSRFQEHRVGSKENFKFFEKEKAETSNAATPWTVSCQTPLSMEFSRQEYWSGLPCSPPGIFPTQELNPGLLHCRQLLYQLSLWFRKHKIRNLHNIW